MQQEQVFLGLINGQTALISNLNSTTASILTSLSKKQDLYAAERQYQSRAYDSVSVETTTILFC